MYSAASVGVVNKPLLVHGRGHSSEEVTSPQLLFVHGWLAGWQAEWWEGSFAERL